MFDVKLYVHSLMNCSDSALLYFAPHDTSCTFRYVAQCQLVVSYRRFGTASQFYSYGLRHPRSILRHLDSRTWDRHYVPKRRQVPITPHIKPHTPTAVTQPKSRP